MCYLLPTYIYTYTIVYLSTPVEIVLFNNNNVLISLTFNFVFIRNNALDPPPSLAPTTDLLNNTHPRRRRIEIK